MTKHDRSAGASRTASTHFARNWAVHPNGFFRPKMGGFQPFLRAPRQFHMVAKLMLVDGSKRQTAARWDRYRPVPKRSETAQLFLISAISRASLEACRRPRGARPLGPNNPGGGPAHASLPCRCIRGPVIQPVSLPLRPATAVP